MICKVGLFILFPFRCLFFLDACVYHLLCYVWLCMCSVLCLCVILPFVFTFFSQTFFRIVSSSLAINSHHQPTILHWLFNVFLFSVCKGYTATTTKYKRIIVGIFARKTIVFVRLIRNIIWIFFYFESCYLLFISVCVPSFCFYFSLLVFRLCFYLFSLCTWFVVTYAPYNNLKCLK